MIVSVRGAVDAVRWASIEAVLGDLIDAQGNLDVVLDLSGLVCLDRDAVPFIVHAAHRAHSHGGRLRLADQACRDHWGAAGR